MTLSTVFRACAVAAVAVATTTPAVAGEPIYIRPGQCILVGSQQVCGMMETGVVPGVRPSTQRMHICQYGPIPDSDVPNAKGYSHVLLTIKEDGTKTETHIRSFGPLDEHKAACEGEAHKAQLDPKL